MRYRFEEVRAALHKHWGYGLARGSLRGSERHDGRWNVSHSRTGYIVSGTFPGHRYSHTWFRSLTAIVHACELAKVIEQQRKIA